MEIHYEFSEFPLLLEVARARFRSVESLEIKVFSTTFKALPELQAEMVSFKVASHMTR